MNHERDIHLEPSTTTGAAEWFSSTRRAQKLLHATLHFRPSYEFTEDYGEVKPRETGGIPVEYVNRRREE